MQTSSTLPSSINPLRVITTLLVAVFTAGSAMQLQAADAKAVTIADTSFRCLAEMTPVRGFFVDNLIGDLDATLAAANSNGESAYPAGSVVQLVPGEAMVKLVAGTSPATKDWEFFELTASAEGTKIGKRGFVDVNNRFGGNCFTCHIKAEPKWDMVCEQGRGCDPLPLTQTAVRAIQKTDPRCSVKQTLTAEEIEALGQLQRLSRPAAQ